mgnify:CR=1 FL=1|tara:strand:+ start:208 stop:405 length:198 start_codon:yes stop_codon:yes gene_type:complete
MLRRKKFKSYLITNIPESDWLKFKRWTAIEGYETLNDALSKLIKLAGNNDLKGDGLKGGDYEQTT